MISLWLMGAIYLDIASNINCHKGRDHVIDRRSPYCAEYRGNDGAVLCRYDGIACQVLKRSATKTFDQDILITYLVQLRLPELSESR